MPAADQVLFNRHYVIGYSFYFRQAKWALEIVGGGEEDRADNFRPDYRVPPMFRADLPDYRNSGYDRGHLVAAANRAGTEIENSETFLLSNMSPQVPGFNRGIWKQLEAAIRHLDDNPRVLETYVVSGPIFYFDQPVELIGARDDNGVTLPIPNAYFKAILTEGKTGRLDMWAFVLPNADIDDELETFRVSTAHVEQFAGIELWSRLHGDKITDERNRIRGMWSEDPY